MRGFNYTTRANWISLAERLCAASQSLIYSPIFSFSLSRQQKTKPPAAVVVAVVVLLLRKVALLEIVSPAALKDKAALVLVVTAAVKFPSATMLALVPMVPLKAVAEVALVLKGPPEMTEEVVWWARWRRSWCFPQKRSWRRRSHTVVKSRLLPALVMLHHSIPSLGPLSLHRSVSPWAAPTQTVWLQSGLCVWTCDLKWMYLFMVVVNDLSA